MVAMAFVAASCGVTFEIDLEAGTDQQLAASDEPATQPTSTAAPTPEATPAPTVTPTPTAAAVVTPTPRAQLGYDEAIAVYFGDVERFWAGPAGPELGLESFEPVDARFPYDPSSDDVPRCAGQLGPREIYVGNAFYCEPDDYIAWDDVGLFPDLYRTYGDFTVGLVIAHEYGHAVQSRAGIDGPTIFVELQADCLAGAWAGSVADDDTSGVPLDQADLDNAIGGFLTFADPLGTPAGDPTAHGTAFDRLNAFAEGFAGGVGVCRDYISAPPLTATILLDPSDANEGNLPLDELLPLLIEDLGRFLQITGTEVAGGDFVAPTDLIQIDAVSPLPACGERLLDPDEIDGAAWLCEADNTIYADRSELDDLFAEVGDFAPSYAVAHAWATAVSSAVLAEPVDVVVAGDCLVGYWARDIFDEATARPLEPVHVLFLSAGDLDEGIVGLLLASATLPSLADVPPVSTFDRVAAFSSGFFRGLGECGLG